MSFRFKIFTGFFIWLLCFKAYGHDPDICFAHLYNTGKENKWQLKLSFSSAGLVRAMRIHYQDSNLIMDPSMEFRKKLDEYIHETVNIRVNKYMDVQLGSIQPVLGNHSSELVFDLLNVPGFSSYWQVSVKVLEPVNNRKSTVLFRFEKDRKYELSELKAEQGFSAAFMVEEDGSLKEVQH